ncbi:hypothetical protein I79_016327 [Cricetulus griseus]|uniref:Uncharacterized protein n=1 Tax=Cricetulus griseus TaxID=10029 RepID=G3HZ32_CRIGR|nr:hypothetical protein I79_016327 [Cricetulus griseus]
MGRGQGGQILAHGKQTDLEEIKSKKAWKEKQKSTHNPLEAKGSLPSLRILAPKLMLSGDSSIKV